MKQILLTKGAVALVDDEDFDEVSKHSWCLQSKGYAASRIDNKLVLLHRFIMKAKKGQIIDHINRSKLDNRKSNLRFCSLEQNASNHGSLGVYLKKSTNKFVAQIMINGKTTHLGYFNDKLDAIKKYKEAKLQKENKLWAK